MALEWRVRWREIASDRRAEFLAKGHRQRSFFPHRLLFLPRAGPDGAKLAEWMCGEHDASRLWEVVLFADASRIAEFPADLFFDDDVIWHRQHFGRRGHVAYADVVVADREMWSMSHVSDLVQRIGRRREHKTRVENRLKGWHDMLLNGLLAFAVERGVRRVRIPTAELQMRHTDPARKVEPELFERIYDRSVNRLLSATRAGGWWLVDVERNRDRLVAPAVQEERQVTERIVCLSHDIEAGLGHAGIDSGMAEQADREWRRSVAAMLKAEDAAEVRATYNVAGVLLPQVRDEIESGGHCIGFHSYDHRLDGLARMPRAIHRFARRPRVSRVTGRAPGVDQLAACRRIDYRIKGYRLPQSRFTDELTDANLLFHNFEWIASSAYSLGAAQAELRNGIVRIPVHLDDFDLYRKRKRFDEWQAGALDVAAAHDVAVISLHDCYAHLWLDRYRQLLEALRDLATLRTLDELAADVTLASAV